MQQYSSTVTATLAADGWNVTFGTVRRGLAGCGPTKSPPRYTKCNSQCTNFILLDVAL